MQILLFFPMTCMSMTHNHVTLILFLILLIFALTYILGPATVTSFVTQAVGWVLTIFHMDCYNSLLTGLMLHTLHVELFVLHRAARAILSKPNSDHITHLCTTTGGDECIHGICCSDSVMDVHCCLNSSSCMRSQQAAFCTSKIKTEKERFSEC